MTEFQNKLMHEEKVALLNVLESHPANVNSNLVGEKYEEC